MKYVQLFEQFIDGQLFEANIPIEFGVNFPNSKPSSRKFNQTIFDWLSANADSLNDPKSVKEFLNILKSGAGDADAATLGFFDPKKLGGLMPREFYGNPVFKKIGEAALANTIISSPNFGKISMGDLYKKLKKSSGDVYYQETENIINNGYPWTLAANIDSRLRYSGWDETMEPAYLELIKPNYNLESSLKDLWHK